MTINDDLGEYHYALKADHDASATIRWAGPIIVFGWIILIAGLTFFALVLLATVVLIVQGLTSDGSSGLFAGVAASTLFTGFAVLVGFILQAALILVVGYYVRMRGNWIRYQVGAQLNGQ